MMVDVLSLFVILNGVYVYCLLLINFVESIVSVVFCLENILLFFIFFYLYLGVGYFRIIKENEVLK